MTRPTPGIILIVTLLFVLVNVAVASDIVAITARQTVVRAGPDSKQRILATVPQGTTLALLERSQGWYKVLLDDGQEGWVAQSAAQVQDGRSLAVVPVGTTAAPGRTALVIGNAAYSEDIGSLKNPGNDATDMAATLRQLGFAVTLVRDANHQRMAEAVEAFSLQPNPWGLYDTHGNVWEWVQDWYGNYTSSTAVDPAGPSTGSLRVLRGGGWGSPARICRSALRRGGAPGFRDVYLGIRLLRVAQ